MGLEKIEKADVAEKTEVLKAVLDAFAEIAAAYEASRAMGRGVPEGHSLLTILDGFVVQAVGKRVTDLKPRLQAAFAAEIALAQAQVEGVA